MKKSLLIFGLISIFSVNSFAKDVAVGSCELKLKGNKTRYRSLKKSIFTSDDMVVTAGKRFNLTQKLSRVYIEPENKTKIHENVITLFDTDLTRLEPLDNNEIDYVVVNGGNDVYIKVHYIAEEGGYGGKSIGPAIVINSVGQNGSLKEDSFKLKFNKDRKFSYRIYSRINNAQLNEEGAAIANIRKEREIVLKCKFQAKKIDEVNIEELAPENGDAVQAVVE